MSGNDNELPGMWSHADFTGGDPDERSYAERARARAAMSWQISQSWPIACEEAEAIIANPKDPRVGVRAERILSYLLAHKPA